MPSMGTNWLKLWLKLLGLFLIPFGGGIPSGVIFAKTAEIDWRITALTYLLSDIVLAFVYEILMLWVIKTSSRSPAVMQTAVKYKENLVRMGFTNLVTPTPLSLIMLSLGVDPMTSRTVSHFAGRGFFAGWLFAITGDMLFFGAIMASTLWLNNILGDGTMASIIIMIAMFAIPALIKRVRGDRTPAA